MMEVRTPSLKVDQTQEPRHFRPRNSRSSRGSARFSRREFLEKAGVGLALVAGAGLGVTLGLQNRANDFPACSPESTSNNEKKYPKAEKALNIDSFENLMFKNFTPEEIAQARNEAEKEYERTTGQVNWEQRAKQSLYWHGLVERVTADLVKEGKVINPEDQDAKIILALATIMLESSGFELLEAGQIQGGQNISKEDNKNPIIDQGLTQIRRQDVEPFASMVGLTQGFKLKDPEDNLKLYFAYQKYLEGGFNGLAPAVHNWGWGNTDEAIRHYEKVDRRVPVSEVNDNYSGKRYRPSLDYIKTDKINMVKLTSSDAVSSHLKSRGFGELNLRYFYILLANAKIINQFASTR